MKPTLAVPLLALLVADALAQSPTPMAAPRARWTLTPGVTGTPTQRRDNPGAASTDRLYLFGGRDGNANSTVHNALYEFDGTAWTQKTADTSATGFPTARGGACVAWDFTRSKLIVFGGDTGTGLVGGPVVTTALLGDTWEWDPVSNAWTDVTPALSPSPRRYAAMSWDPVTGGMLLFGGDNQISPAQLQNDTWLFLAGTWIPLAPATVPSARRMHSLVTRPDFGDLLMCAGVLNAAVGTGTNAIDVWAWRNNDWQQLNNGSVTFPHGCAGNQAVYDAFRQRVVLQGGNGLRVIDNTWPATWDGSPSTWCSEFDSYTNQWSLCGAATFNVADPVIGRASRYFAGFVPALGKVYKVSGQNPSGVVPTTGTCQYQADPLASFTATSPGCAGAAGTPNLTSAQRPWLGRAFAMEVQNVPANAVAFIALGWGSISLPLSSIGIGSASCIATVNPLGTFLALPSGPAGNPTLSLALPNLAALIGGTPLGFQAVVLEPATATVSNRADAVFGAL